MRPLFSAAFALVMMLCLFAGIHAQAAPDRHPERAICTASAKILPQFPSAEICLANYREANRLKNEWHEIGDKTALNNGWWWGGEEITQYERCDRLERIWYAAWENAAPCPDREASLAYLKTLHDLIGEHDFTLGILPPVNGLLPVKDASPCGCATTGACDCGADCRCSPHLAPR